MNYEIAGKPFGPIIGYLTSKIIYESKNQMTELWKNKTRGNADLYFFKLIKVLQWITFKYG